MIAIIYMLLQLCAMAGLRTPLAPCSSHWFWFWETCTEAQREAQVTPRACRIKMMKTLPQSPPLCPQSLGRGRGIWVRAEAGESQETLTSGHFLSSRPSEQAEAPLVATSWRGGP